MEINVNCTNIHKTFDNVLRENVTLDINICEIKAIFGC